MRTITVPWVWIGPLRWSYIAPEPRRASNPRAVSKACSPPELGQHVPPVPSRTKERRNHSASELGNGAGDPPARWMRLTRLSNGTARHHARYTVSSPARSGAGRSASPSRSSTASVNAGSSATARSVRAPRFLTSESRMRRRATRLRLRWQFSRSARRGNLTGRSSSVTPAMDFRDTPEEAAFRAEVRAWLAEHLTGEFAALGLRRRTGRRDRLGDPDRVGADPRRRPVGRACRGPRSTAAAALDVRAAGHLQRGVRAGERAGAHRRSSARGCSLRR